MFESFPLHLLLSISTSHEKQSFICFNHRHSGSVCGFFSVEAAL
jgi:hypothetical protein